MSETGGTRFQLNKLVRDGIVEDMLEKGQMPEVRKLSGIELDRALTKKIQEEAAELDPESDHLIDELVDVLEGVDELAIKKGMSPEKLRLYQKERRLKRGGFSAGNYVLSLTLQEGDPWAEYYRKEPDRFPEITEE